MEGLFLPLDIIHNSLCPYFSLSTLAFCQSVSRSWFSIFIADAAYAHIRRRICAAIPLFIESFPWVMTDQVNRVVKLKPSKAKKLKLAWIFPKTGTWRVLKRYMSKLCTLRGARELCVSGKSNLVAEVIILNFPKRPRKWWYEKIEDTHIHKFFFYYKNVGKPIEIVLHSTYVYSFRLSCEIRIFNAFRLIMGWKTKFYTVLNLIPDSLYELMNK